MCRLYFRVLLLIIILVTISEKCSWAANYYQSDPGKKYTITFGDSFHNYLPKSSIRIGVLIKNNSSEIVKVSQEFVILDTARIKVWKTIINLDLSPNGSVSIPLIVPVPKLTGSFTFTLREGKDKNDSSSPSFSFNVIQPKKSQRLSKILVHTPDWEEGLNAFLKLWDIKAPTISWGQVLLCGKKSLNRFADGDQEIIQLVSRALKREMSVIFLDFGLIEDRVDQLTKIVLPFDVAVSLIKAKSPEQSFVLKSDYKELTYNFEVNRINQWNGFRGVTVPATDFNFTGKGVKINSLAISGSSPYRYPVVELIPENEKGKLYLCQIITDGRLDESVKPPRNRPELAAYDPMAVQFLLNLISASVGDNLLK